MTLAPSMTADVCDPDEVTMRVRREVLFSAVLGWMLKVALPSSIFLAGVALALTGGQTALEQAQPTETLQAMRIAFSAGTVVLALVAAVLIAGYRITEQDVAAARATVRSRRT